MAEKQNENILRNVKPSRIIWPILFGLGVVGYMLYREFDPNSFSQISFTRFMLLWLFISLLMMAIRDIGYIIRLKVLSEGDLSWRQCFNLIMLWEFTSAITPSAIGGTGVALYFVHKEGISVGRSSAIIMATSFLDELYFIIMFPLLLMLVSGSDLFVINPESTNQAYSFTNEFFYFAVIGYSVKLLYTLFVSYGLFFNPRGLKYILLWLFKFPIIRRWRHRANDAGTELITSSRQLKSKSFGFWLKAFGATVMSWSARYWVVNFLLLAFAIDLGLREHFVIFARQLVMWIMMLISPTPGGSGFAEYVFNEFLGQFIPYAGFAIAMAFIWRLATYYPYLFIGTIMLPRWIQSKFGKKLKQITKKKKKP